MTLTVGYDATHANLPHVPGGHQMAGYTTGSPDIMWTRADWDAHPGALRYCQDAGATDTTADVLDVERGAATPADCPGWYKAALAHYQAGTRPGQRLPAIYCSQSNATAVANALIAGGVASGPHLIIANWSVSEATAEADVNAASGPFPLAGFQFASLQSYDIDVWSSGWLANVSKPPPRLTSVGVVAHFSDGTMKTWTA